MTQTAYLMVDCMQMWECVVNVSVGVMYLGVLGVVCVCACMWLGIGVYI